MRNLVIIFIMLFGLFSWSHITEANSNNQLIIINKATNQLAFYNDGKRIRTFSVATGRERSLTPEGKFKIVNKIVNRPYYKSNIPGGDPRNPLGDRWLGINARGTYGTTYAIHGNNNPSSIGTYASAGCIRMHNEEVRWLFNQVKVNTPVIITHSKNSFDSIAKSNGYSLESKLRNVTVNKTSPQPANTTVTLTANTSAGTNPVYRFSVHDGKKWTTIRNYSSSKTAKWKPTKPGSYKLKVEVRNKSSRKNFEDQRVINYTVFQRASIKSVNTNKTSPQPSNTSVRVTASSNSNKNNLFKFSVYDGNKWRTVQKYSSNNKLTWKPTKSGSYKIKVEVKHRLSKNKRDHERTINYRVYAPARINSLKADKSLTQPINTNIILTTSTNSSSNNLIQYRVHDGERWRTVQSYSSDRKLNWKPTKPGTYKVKARVKHKSSNKTFDQERTLQFTIYEPAVIKSFSTDQSTPSEIDTNIILAADTTKQGDHLFRFSVHDGTKWSTLQSYSSTKQVNWKPSKAGNYKLRVDVKDKHSNKSFDQRKEMNYVISHPIKDIVIGDGGVLTTNSDTLIKAITSEIIGLEYKFEVYENDQWNILQNYSSSDRINWNTPEQPGKYTVKVSIKTKNSNTEHFLEKEVTVVD
ncbi:triple tyrosine motif-containing protein [Alkalihalobacterium elongatum]|uniref:triple tyrosine motif-containing protein n=1 Tax=Alkalihalobacterium elongatum TaxID=2675466 RepID=UPI001C1FC038|nr:triple tyrosine motif-containing protein [Alkalihalobacterium elongatum]